MITAAADYLPALEIRVARGCARFLETGMDQDEFRHMLANARDLAHRTGRTLDQVLAENGIAPMFA